MGAVGRNRHDREVRRAVPVRRGPESIAGFETDLYESVSTAPLPRAILFHSSNGFRHDLIQLAWSLAERGMSARTVTWIGGATRQAFPEAYTAMRQFLCAVMEADESATPTVVVTWVDSSIVVLTELNRLEQAGMVHRDVSVVTIAGVFGWPTGPPAAIAGSAAARQFFGADLDPNDWSSHTPLATLGERAPLVPLTSITTRSLVDQTSSYHRAARAAGKTTRLLIGDGPELAFIAPRLATGRAVRDLIVGSAEPRRPRTDEVAQPFAVD